MSRKIRIGKAVYETVRVCSVCGKRIKYRFAGKMCPYCNGTIITKVVKMLPARRRGEK